MKRVYLCSRVAYDARPLNDAVSNSLRKAGYEVYVPHEQAPNNLSAEDIEHGRYDKATIFKLDFTAMKRADACVVVGRHGKDCSWELGWFYARQIPVFFVPADDATWSTAPMVIPTLTQYPPIPDPDLTGNVLDFYLGGPR